MRTPKELQAKAHADREKAKAWLSRYIQPGVPKALTKPKAFTKEDLRSAAMPELQVSKSAFDYAWDWVILETGCEHWYEPLPRRRAKPLPT